MIRLPIKGRITSDVQGNAYVNVSEPDKLDRSLRILSQHNLNRLDKLEPTETNRFTTIYFNPLLTFMKAKRKTIQGNITPKYAQDILAYIGDVGVKFATVAEVANRVTSSAKEADAFMSTITKESPLLIPFGLKVDADDKQVNLALFVKLSGSSMNSETAKNVIDGITFPKEGTGPMGDSWSMAAMISTFIARPARPLTSSEIMTHIDDVIAFHKMTEEIEASPVKGAVNCAMALHIILDSYMSMLMPGSTAMSALHQELSGQTSVVSLDVIRRITSSMATVSLAAYLAVPTLRLLHISDLATATVSTLEDFIPKAEAEYRSTYQTLELMKSVKNMVIPYIQMLYEASGSYTTLSNSEVLPGISKPMPAVLRKMLDPAPEYDVMGALDGALPLDVLIPFKIKTLTRTDYFALATEIEDQMAQYRAHVLNYNVVIAEYFRHVEVGLLPASFPDQQSVMGLTEITTTYATPFSPPSSIRPTKYDAQGNWTLAPYINKPFNRNYLIKEIIAEQAARYVFSPASESLVNLGGTQGARFLAMPIPGCYAAFTERFSMNANISTFLDLLAGQATITSRDKFFEDLTLLFMYSKGTDDFVHLFRAIAPYFIIDFDYTEAAGKAYMAEYVGTLRKQITAWGYPIQILDDKVADLSPSSYKLGVSKIVTKFVDPSYGDILTVTYKLRTKFPKPTALTSIRVSALKKVAMMQSIATHLLVDLEATEALAAEAPTVDMDDLSYTGSTALDTLLAEDGLSKVKEDNIGWLHNSSFYHQTAYAPHLSLRVSKSFSEAFAYVPTDITNLLSYSLIVTNDSEGFSQVFAKREFDPVMVLMEDEDADSFPSLGSSPTNAPHAQPSSQEVKVKEHADEGQLALEKKEPVPGSDPAKIKDDSDDAMANAKDEVSSADLVNNLQPDPEAKEAQVAMSPEEIEKAKLAKKLKKKAADDKEEGFDNNTQL